MTRYVDIDQLSAADLEHIAASKRELKRREAEERTARLAEVMYKPALGWYLRQRDDKGDS